MRKRKQKKNNVHFIECNNNHISQEKMIEIHAEAYYKALKRIEDEKSERGEKIIEFMRMFLLCLFRVCWVRLVLFFSRLEYLECCARYIKYLQ